MKDLTKTKDQVKDKIACTKKDSTTAAEMPKSLANSTLKQGHTPNCLVVGGSLLAVIGLLYLSFQDGYTFIANTTKGNWLRPVAASILFSVYKYI